MTECLFTSEDHTEKYRNFRPNYPDELYDEILNYYFNGTKTNEKIPLAIDVGCGSGQATVDLSKFCDHVIGTDVSQNQITNAIPKDNVEYHCIKGEDLSFASSNSVDLITVATALHWINIDEFVREVKRVLKPSTGVLAIWTYRYAQLENQQANEITHEFFYKTLFPYWNEKQHLVEDFYESLLPQLPFETTIKKFDIERQIQMSLDAFIGFIETGSACQTFRRQNGEVIYQKTLDTLKSKLTQILSSSQHDPIQINFSNPIRLYLFRKNQA